MSSGLAAREALALCHGALGLAFDAAKDAKRTGEMAASAKKSAKSSDLETWWEVDERQPDGHRGRFVTRGDGLRDEAALASKPDSALLPKAALYLVNHRKWGYYWNSTKQTAMVIYGLTESTAT